LIYIATFVAATAAISVFGQDISGTIEGTILDQSQGAVANATVTITNVDRDQVLRRMTTGSDGIYTGTLLPVGAYSVKVEAPGFKTSTISGIALHVSDDLRINVTLEVGQVSESVDVSGEVANVELSTSANENVIQGVQVRELPLGTRNYEQLVALMPGVTANTTDELFIGNSAPAGTVFTTPFSINGNRNSANNWAVDGADNVDRGGNLTLMTFPSVDSIAEFKVQRSLYSADTGRAGGGQISVVTKSGSTQFHGSLYEFNRNDALAANNWINNTNKVNVVNGKAKAPALRWNDFGGTIGGPVKLPGLNHGQQKTFFFFSEEARRVVTYTTFQPTIPTSPMIAGTMPTPVCLTGNSPCTGTVASVVPPSLISKAAQQYVKDIFSKVPLNGTSTTAGFFSQRNVFNSRQEIVRLDHNFGDKTSVWVKFENDVIPTVEPGGFGIASNIPNLATTETQSPGRAYLVHLQNVFRPTLLNEGGFNYTNSAIHVTVTGLMAKANSPDINPSEPFTNSRDVAPNVTFTSGSSLAGNGPYDEANRNYAFFDNLSWQRGRHAFKFGFVVNRYNKTENAYTFGNNAGTFAFSSTGAPTGTTAFTQAFANFLVGNVSTFTQTSLELVPDLWSWQSEAYAQDEYRFSPRVTLTAGVRWSYFGTPSDSGGRLTNFAPAAYSAASAAKIDSATGNIVAGSVALPYTNGLIIGGQTSPFGSKVVNDTWLNFAPRVGFALDPYGDGRMSIRAGYGIYYDSPIVGHYETAMFLNPPFVQSVTYNNAPFDNVTSGVTPGTVSTVFARAEQLPGRTPYSQSWSFTIQRQLPKGAVLEVGYAGSKGTHLLGSVDINQAKPGAALAAGLHAPGPATIFTGTDSPRINAVRPYLGYNAINAVESAFDSNYHSLQTSLRKQFRDGSLVNFAFTWSKNLTDNPSDRSNAPQNTYNWHEGEYGPATLDRQKVVSANYVYVVPVFRNAKGVTAAVLKGWQASGLLSFYTGSPFTVSTSNLDPAGQGLIGNSAAALRPDLICDPNSNAPNTIAQWFNTGCFVPVAQGQVRPGNAGRGVVRGPGYANWDAALAKAIAIREKVKLQLRGEAINAINHPNPNGFASTNNTSTLFGQINTFRAARRMQLALKLEF
jgi:hypothetical protein